MASNRRGVSHGSPILTFYQKDAHSMFEASSGLLGFFRSDNGENQTNHLLTPPKVLVVEMANRHFTVTLRIPRVAGLTNSRERGA